MNNHSITDNSWSFRVVVKIESTARNMNFCLEVEVRGLQLSKVSCFKTNGQSQVMDYSVIVAKSVRVFAKYLKTKHVFRSSKFKIRFDKQMTLKVFFLHRSQTSSCGGPMALETKIFIQWMSDFSLVVFWWIRSTFLLVFEQSSWCKTPWRTAKVNSVWYHN